MTDPFVGQLIFFRVYSGVLNSGDTVYNPIKGKKERIGRILQMHANEREEIKEVRAGDIAAAVGLKEATTGDTLCDLDKPIILERMIFPEPVISQAVEPKTKADQEKMGMALQSPRAGRPVVPRAHRRGNRPDDHLGHGRAAPGDHRRPHEARVRRRGQRRQAAGGLPRDDHARRSTRSKASSSSSPAAAASTATSVLKIEPQEPARASSSSTPSRAAPCRASTSRRSRRACARRCPAGVLAGYPVVDVKVTLFDGSYHEVDSNENAFKMAASIGFKDGMRRASPVLLEPIMAVEVETPEDYMGNVMGDLSSRRGRSRAWTTCRRRQDHQGRGAAGGDVRLLDHPALAHAGPRHLHDGIQALRRSAEERRRGDHQPESCSLTPRGPRRDGVNFRQRNDHGKGQV